MADLNIRLPQNLEISEFEIKMILASKLYELGKVSSGQAAEMLNLSKRSFLELLGKCGASVFGYTGEELEEDLKNL